MCVDSVTWSFWTYLGEVQGAAIRKPLNMSSQYSAGAERKQVLLDTWRKCLKCKWESDLASGKALPRLSLEFLCLVLMSELQGIQKYREEFLNGVLGLNVPGIGGEVYMEFIIWLIEEDTEKSCGCCMEVDKRRRWRWDTNKMDQCLDIASMFLSRFSFLLYSYD